MGVSIDVNSQNFETEVLLQSHEQPVVVDFFATWCGPCQMLKPMLEKLVTEYDCVLAKVDIDQNPDLANVYGVEGVPDVKFFLAGQVVDGFVGVLPEPQIRDRLAQLGLESALERGLKAIAAAEAAADPETAKRQFAHLMQQYPEDRRLILAGARFLIQQGSYDSAIKLLSAIQPSEAADYRTAVGLQGMAQFQQAIADIKPDSELDQLYLQGAKAAIAQDHETALSYFLQVVERDRRYRDDGGRKAMVALFNLLGDEAALTQAYRRRLMQALY
ncbi:tetratricopeptide repeat protein [Almyronema epifaneia]|uniref:Tetratricopeptide repeat protein n=1 Tax=Almyronema epifaneia S1 TaxID=2991925 RepID=A0ABW6IC51_9CYAN